MFKKKEKTLNENTKEKIKLAARLATARGLAKIQLEKGFDKKSFDLGFGAGLIACGKDQETVSLATQLSSIIRVKIEKDENKSKKN